MTSYSASSSSTCRGANTTDTVSPRPDLPLFDLPLHGDLDDEPAPAEDQPEPVTAGSGQAASQSRLFEDDPPNESRADVNRDGEVGEDDSDDEVPFDEDVGVLDRLIGGVVDVSIHAAVLFSVGSASWLIGVRPVTEAWPAFAVFLLLFSLLYTCVPLAFWGQTPGMMRVGHVARTGSGEPLTFGQTALRWFGSLLTLALLGLPLLLALGASSRSLADRVSGSYTEAS